MMHLSQKGHSSPHVECERRLGFPPFASVSSVLNLSPLLLPPQILGSLLPERAFKSIWRFLQSVGTQSTSVHLLSLPTLAS